MPPGSTTHLSQHHFVLCAVNSRPTTALWGIHRQLLGPQRPCLGAGQQCFPVKSAQTDVSAGGRTDPIMRVPIAPAGGLAGATSRPLTASGSTPLHMSLSPLSGATNTLPVLPWYSVLSNMTSDQKKLPPLAVNDESSAQCHILCGTELSEVVHTTGDVCIGWGRHRFGQA